MNSRDLQQLTAMFQGIILVGLILWAIFSGPINEVAHPVVLIACGTCLMLLVLIMCKEEDKR